jgi:hypothetical protein
MSEYQDRRSKLTPGNIGMWIAIGTLVYGFIAILVKAQDLPPRVTTLESIIVPHCAAQVQFEKGYDTDMKDIKGMLRELLSERRKVRSQVN